MSYPDFETDRLLLKKISSSDFPAYTKHFVDYEVIRNLSAQVPWPYPKDGVATFLQQIVFPDLGKDRWMWGIFTKESPDEVIGAVDLWRNGVPENRGFWLGKMHWGKGYMTEAVTCINSFAFEELKFERLVFANAVGNERSRRVKEKTGAILLRVEPAEFVDPKLTEHEIWELTEHAWRNFQRSSQ